MNSIATRAFRSNSPIAWMMNKSRHEISERICKLFPIVSSVYFIGDTTLVIRTTDADLRKNFEGEMKSMITDILTSSLYSVKAYTVTFDEQNGTSIYVSVIPVDYNPNNLSKEWKQ